MIVNIKKLLDAIHKTMWKQGHVHPEDLKHVVNPDGSHTFTLTVKREDAVWEETKGNPNASYPGVGWNTPRKH